MILKLFLVSRFASKKKVCDEKERKMVGLRIAVTEKVIFLLAHLNNECGVHT